MKHKESFGKRVLKYASDHKIEIARTTGEVIGCVAVIAFLTHRKNIKELNKVMVVELTDVEKAMRAADETIFTKLAPAIEEAVINNGIETFSKTETFDMDGVTKVVDVVMHTVSEN